MLVFMRVAPNAGTGCAAKPAHVLGDGLGGRVKQPLAGWGRAGYLGWRWEGISRRRLQSPPIGVEATIVALLGVAESSG